MTSSSAPRMVNSYKRTSSPRSPTNSGELFTPAHEENVRFIHDTFTPVDLSDLKKRNTQDSKKS
uniref:MAPK regulated corepressor interacting protein 1 n=4 Tax=Percomorphaceae TaxID=1489872 RepID=A0A3P9PNT0_POERE